MAYFILAVIFLVVCIILFVSIPEKIDEPIKGTMTPEQYEIERAAYEDWEENDKTTGLVMFIFGILSGFGVVISLLISVRIR